MSQRVVLLTGAAGGLGRAMALGLAAAGHAVVLVDHAERALDEAVTSIRSAHPAARIAAVVADLTDIDGLPALAARATDRFGPIEVLINNAGLGVDHVRRDFLQRPVRFWEIDQDQARRFFAVNGLAPFLLARWLVPAMMARSWGRIINVTTSLDTMIRGGFAPYGGTKASLEAHSAIMAQDLEGSGVTVNVLVPGGPADTGMIPVETGFDRARLIRPEVMVPPLLYLVAEVSDGISGQRVIAVEWDSRLGPHEALARAGMPAAWPNAGTQTRWPGGAAPSVSRA